MITAHPRGSRVSSRHHAIRREEPDTPRSFTVIEFRRFLALGILGLIAIASSPGARGDDDPAPTPSPDVTEPPPYEEFVVIPLRVHILSASDLPEVDCRLSDTDVTRILGKVNHIW